MVTHLSAGFSNLENFESQNSETLQRAAGWTQIAAFLPLRSENDVKNIWHSTLRCKDTQKRSFLRTYALAVHDNAYDYAARKAMFDMAVRQCGPPPQAATEMINRVQMLLDNPDLQAVVHQEHLQHEQLLAAAAHQHAAAAAAAQAQAAQLQLQQQAAQLQGAQQLQQQALGLQPHEQLLLLLHQQRQQEQRQTERERQQQERRASGEDRAGRDAPLPGGWEHQQAPAISPARAALERDEGGAGRPATERRGGRSGGADGGGEMSEALLERERKLPGRDDGGLDGPQLSVAQLLQLQQQLNLAKGQGAPPSPTQQQLQGPRANSETGANGGALQLSARPSLGAGTGIAMNGDAVLAHLAAATGVGSADAPALAALAGAAGVKAGPLSRSPSDPPQQPGAAQGLDGILNLLARYKTDSMQASARQLGPRGAAWAGTAGGDERETGPLALGALGAAGRADGLADWDDARSGGKALPGGAGGSKQPAPGVSVKVEGEESGGADGSGATSSGAAKRPPGRAGLPVAPLGPGGEPDPAAAAPRASSRAARDSGPYSLEGVDSDELGAVEALALAARLHGQSGRGGGPAVGASRLGGPSTGGPRASTDGRASAASGRGGAAGGGGAGTAHRVSGAGGPGPVLDLQPRGLAGSTVIGNHTQQLQPGRLPSAQGRPRSSDALPGRGRNQAAATAAPRPVAAGATLDIVSLLNIPSQRQQVLALPAPGLATLLCSPNFGVDCEASVLLLLAEWRAAQAAAATGGGAGVSREHLQVLCGALRLAALGAFHLTAVLPHLLTADPRSGANVAVAGPGAGRWFEMRPDELAFLLRYVNAGETERAHLAEAAAGVYDCSSPWYDPAPRPLSPAAADGFCFQWHIPMQGLRDALRSGSQPHASFTIGEDDDAGGISGAGPGPGGVVALPCVVCRGLEWYVFIDCQQRGAAGSPSVAGVFVYCSVPAALRVAPEPGGPSRCVGVMPGAGIRLGVYGWRCNRLEEVFVWTFGDETFFAPEAGVGCPTALPLRRRTGSPAAVPGEDLAGPWADYLHEGSLRGSLTFLPP
ncbi:hypothetical protein GPECTOR_5g313 [Gonium pectorale]|uniref:Uncharacterized protein n=1 Tax=Gonium pectorale TaxID=33097 RepID=A0A150GWI7_GONPE|nr:hypothetical protein GPECTOR_5g313 [Gonium pectorale]|eukprot:KXZ54221.1 hypothetical protein GPECTOR_5g313 [Gonium pectorale]